MRRGRHLGCDPNHNQLRRLRTLEVQATSSYSHEQVGLRGKRNATVLPRAPPKKDREPETFRSMNPSFEEPAGFRPMVLPPSPRQSLRAKRQKRREPSGATIPTSTRTGSPRVFLSATRTDRDTEPIPAEPTARIARR